MQRTGSAIPAPQLIDLISLLRCGLSKSSSMVNVTYASFMRKHIEINNLQLLQPEIASEWHPSFNMPLTPSTTSMGCNKQIWWVCKNDQEHSWKATIPNRMRGQGCPHCRSLASVSPSLAAEWHPTLNGTLTPKDISFGSRKKVYWQCADNPLHSYLASAANRYHGKGCPYCVGRRVCSDNSLSAINPIVAAEWHPTLNGNLTPDDVTAGSQKKVWWKCNKHSDHVYCSSIVSRNRGNGCSCCRGLTVVDSNSFANCFPELAAEWHPTLNGELTPNDFSRVSCKKAYWQCSVDQAHAWQAKINNRVHGTGCPFCSSSRGEKAVQSVLDSLEVKYVKQFRLRYCSKQKRKPLRFDFAIAVKDKRGLIEYNGQQHYMPVKGWGGEETFLANQKRDHDKRRACQDVGVPLLEIPYWQFKEINEVVRNFVDSLHTA